MIWCWTRYVRELRADLEFTRGHPDDEVLVFDLRGAGRQIDPLLALIRAKVRAS
jgi:hypothetical protein